MTRILFYCGAGVSVASGLPVFRTDGDALWENHKVDEICNFAHWKKARAKDDDGHIVNFYDDYRQKIQNSIPNEFHGFVASLGEKAHVVTTNVDDLFERGGVDKKQIVHLHGSILIWRCVDANMKSIRAAVLGQSVNRATLKRMWSSTGKSARQTILPAFGNSTLYKEAICLLCVVHPEARLRMRE